MEEQKTNQNIKTKRNLESISQRLKDTKINFKDIIIPLAVGLILIILIIFLFVPMVEAALSFGDEYRDVTEKYEQLEKLERELMSFDEDVFQRDLLNSKKVIPRSLRVSSFVFYIDSLARRLNLESKSISAGDIQITVRDREVSKKDRKVYLGVSSPLSYSGSLDSVLEFLDSLYSASPYIVSVDNVSLRKTGDDWRVTLNVTGYYVPEVESRINLYLPFASYTRYQDIVDIINEKASQLD